MYAPAGRNGRSMVHGVTALQISQTDLDSLPAELLERYPDVVAELREGVIDEVPDAVLDQLPDSVISRIPESLLASDVNMTFVIILAVVAGLAVAGFLYGVTKAAIKAAVFFLLVAAIAAVVLYTQL